MSYTRGGKEGPPTQPTNGGARFRKGERRIGVKEDLLKGWRRGEGRGINLAEIEKSGKDPGGKEGIRLHSNRVR